MFTDEQAKYMVMMASKTLVEIIDVLVTGCANIHDMYRTDAPAFHAWCSEHLRPELKILLMSILDRHDDPPRSAGAPPFSNASLKKAKEILDEMIEDARANAEVRAALAKGETP